MQLVKVFSVFYMSLITILWRSIGVKMVDNIVDAIRRTCYNIESECIQSLNESMEETDMEKH